MNLKSYRSKSQHSLSKIDHTTEPLHFRSVITSEEHDPTRGAAWYRTQQSYDQKLPASERMAQMFGSSNEVTSSSNQPLNNERRDITLHWVRRIYLKVWKPVC